MDDNQAPLKTFVIMLGAAFAASTGAAWCQSGATADNTVLPMTLAGPDNPLQALPLTGLVTDNVTMTSKFKPADTKTLLSASAQTPASTPKANSMPSVPISPARMLDDLSAGAFQMHQQQEAPKAGPVTSIGKTVRYTISDFLEYRPSRSAAQAFLGTNRPSNRDYSPGSKQDPRPNRLISATTEVERESARNESAFQVTTAMMQLAKGFGDLDREAGEKSKEQAIQRLNELLGEGQTRWLVSRFASWATSVESQARREMEQTTKTVDIIDQEDLVNVLAREAAAHDSTTANLKASLGLHDRSPSKAEVILTGATLTPTIIGPAALLTERTLERANGGDRCKRLEVVLALGLNLQERLNLLTRQSALAISSLDRARLSKNTTMYAFSRDLIKKLQGKEPPPAIAGAAKLTP